MAVPHDFDRNSMDGPKLFVWLLFLDSVVGAGQVAPSMATDFRRTLKGAFLGCFSNEFNGIKCGMREGVDVVGSLGVGETRAFGGE